MALYPCDIDGRRYAGNGNSAYAGWAAGSYSERKRYRLCSAHLQEFRDTAERTMRLVARGDMSFELSDDGRTDCWQCGLEPHTVMSFLHLYDRNAEPETYVMHTCAKCNSRFVLDGLKSSSLAP